LVQLNALLHVTQSKFNPYKREIICCAFSYSAGGTCSHVLVHSINWLAKHKTRNDFTVYLRNMIVYSIKITEKFNSLIKYKKML